MRDVCALLTLAFLIGACAPRAAYPVVVRETVTVHDRRQSDAGRDGAGRGAVATRAAAAPPAAVPLPRGTSGALDAGRQEVSSSGVRADLPRVTDRATSDPDPAGPIESSGASTSPGSASGPRAVDQIDQTAGQPIRTRQVPSALTILWFAVAAALCAWGVRLRRSGQVHAARRSRRAA